MKNLKTYQQNLKKSYNNTLNRFALHLCLEHGPMTERLATSASALLQGDWLITDCTRILRTSALGRRAGPRGYGRTPCSKLLRQCDPPPRDGMMRIKSA
jgi:hypothetical protein